MSVLAIWVQRSPAGSCAGIKCAFTTCAHRQWRGSPIWGHRLPKPQGPRGRERPGHDLPADLCGRPGSHFSADGLAAGLKKGSIIADMTTGDPNATRAMADDLKSAGITLIDAPVSGGPHGADAGTIAIMVGAPVDVYARLQPVFESISPNIFHCGDIGTGHTMKLVNNVVAASVRVATFEAVTMGIKAGLSLETCSRVLAKGSARSYTTEITLPKFVKGELKTNFTLGLMHKDVRLATELGVASAVPMPVCNLVREIFQIALNEQGADADVNCLIHLHERLAQVTFAPKQ